MRLIEFLNKKMNEQDDGDYPRPVEELKKLIAVAEQQKSFMESLAKQAQKITTEIKYDDTVRDIIVRIQALAEQIKFEDKGYKSEIESAINDAQEAMNALESAVYGIDEPFKYLLRDIDNDLSELESELEEHKWKRESVDPKQASKPRNFVAKNAKTGGAGAHKDKKKEQKQGYEKHKSKEVAESNVEESHDPIYKLNVVKANEKSGQLKITYWLRQETGLPKDAFVYFDDADLVYGEKTIVPDALVNPKLKMKDLVVALEKAIQEKETQGGGMYEASQAYRDAMAKSREAEINYRADNAEKRLAKKAAEPKTLGQKIKKDIGGPLKKLAKGDIKGALGVSESSHGRYWCSTDKKWKTRQGPKQTRNS